MRGQTTSHDQSLYVNYHILEVIRAMGEMEQQGKVDGVQGRGGCPRRRPHLKKDLEEAK